MKEKEDKYIEQFVDKLMKETPLEIPSPDFTAKVMANVWATANGKATVYKPLISKKGWFLIFGGIISTVIYLLLNGATSNEGRAWSFNISGKAFTKALGNLHLFQFSGITINIILLATVLIFIQITLLKNHLNKRFQK